MLNRKLTGDNGRATAVAVVEHFQQVAPMGVVEHRQPPVIDKEHVYSGQLLEFVGDAPWLRAYGREFTLCRKDHKATLFNLDSTRQYATLNTQFNRNEYYNEQYLG